MRATTIIAVLLGLMVLAGCGGNEEPTLTVEPYEFTAEQVGVIDATWDEFLSVYGADSDLGRPLAPRDRRVVCRHWQDAQWSFDRIPDDVYTVRHGELPGAIRAVTGLPNAEPAQRMVSGYCAHKLGDGG